MAYWVCFRDRRPKRLLPNGPKTVWESLAHLQNAYNKLDREKTFYLETRFLDLLDVKVEPLNFKEDGDYDMPSQPTFFQPMPRVELLAQPRQR